MQLVEKLADATGCLLEIFGTMLGKVWYLSNLKVRPQLCTYRIRECDLLTEFQVFFLRRELPVLGLHDAFGYILGVAENHH